MTRILALEAASQACSVALWCDGVVSELHELAPRRQAERLLPMAQQLLDDSGVSLADCDALAVGQGPGAFTGLRAVMGMTQGLALAAGLPVLGVSNLACLAAGAFRVTGQVGRCLVVQDARMGELYCARFDVEASGDLQRLGEDTLCRPDALSDVELRQAILLAGNAWQAIPELLARADRGLGEVGLQEPHARDVAQLAARDFAAGHAKDPVRLEPAYVRNDVARKPGNR